MGQASCHPAKGPLPNPAQRREFWSQLCFDEQKRPKLAPASETPAPSAEMLGLSRRQHLGPATEQALDTLVAPLNPA